MQLVSYTYKDQTLLGFQVDDKIYSCREIHPQLPRDPTIMQAQMNRYLPLAKLMHTALINGELRRELHCLPSNEVTGIKPIPITEKT